LRTIHRSVHVLVVLSGWIVACGSTDSSETGSDGSSSGPTAAGSSSGSSGSGRGETGVDAAAGASSGGGAGSSASSGSSGGGADAGRTTTGSGSGGGASSDAAADATKAAPDAGRGGGSSSSGSADAGRDASGSSSGGVSAGIDAGPFDAGKAPGTAPANAVLVNPGTYHQRVAGFGASSAWGGGYKNATDPNDLFSTTSGAGLSLFRVRIQPAPAGTTSAGEIQMALAAQKLGATVWATPWTPPAADKSNDNIVEGTLTNPSAWAATLASYVGTMKAAGVNLYAVSVNNEPDANVTYEWCVYTGATMATFVASNLGAALAPTGVKLMEPETQNWFGFATFEPALEANAAAWAATQIVATHEYGGTPAAYPHIQAAGKEFWETEWFVQGAEDATMTNGLVVASEIYQAMTVASVNAWHYWWIYPASADNGALWDQTTNTWAKRMWVLGNFSRWARPGYFRVDVAGAKPAGISVIAFQNPADGTLSVVVINSGGATTVPIFVEGASWPASVVPWITTDTQNLALGATIQLSAGSFMAPVAAKSVTTFVGAP
jgi:glucuronoarabinoxylan endo-1,4-beta-xylanase